MSHFIPIIYYESKVKTMQYEYQNINHEIKDITSDINYKISVLDFFSKKILGSCEYFISYNKINNLKIGSSINFINKVKLLLNYKSQKEMLHLTISSEIIKFNKISIDLNENKLSNSIANTINNINKNKIYNNHNNLKQNFNRNSRKNPFEYIKIKKLNTNIKNENNSNSNIEKNNNYLSSSRTFKKNNKNNNKNQLEIIYKREFASPMIFSDNDKKI